MKNLIKKFVVTVAFFAIMMWAYDAFAWSSELDKRTELFWELRKLIFLSYFFLIPLGFFAALFKRAFWFWLFSLLSWGALFTVTGLVVEFVTVDEAFRVEDIEIIILVLLVFLPICLLPLLITLIQYKRKKIDKKLLKRRLLSWLCCGVSLVVLVLLLMGISRIISFLA